MSGRVEAATPRSQDAPKASKVNAKVHAKSSSNVTMTAICSVCDKAVVIDGGRKSQDSIFCEGLCQAWLHRCCAGLSSVRFAKLCNDSAPFHCPICMSVKPSNDLVEANNALRLPWLWKWNSLVTEKRDKDISNLQEAVKLSDSQIKWSTTV